jgi:hypothetical protein
VLLKICSENEQRIWFDFWCFNAIFSNISAISWRPVIVVEEAGVPKITILQFIFVVLIPCLWHRGGLSLSINIWRSGGGGGASFLLPWGPKILLAALSLPVACSWSVVLFGTPASSTTITGRHDIAEILLKMALKYQNSNLL